MSYEIISEESLNLSTSIENVLVVEESSSIEDVQVEGEGNRDKDEKLYVTLNSGDNGKSERVVRVKSSTPIFASDLNVDLMDELIHSVATTGSVTDVIANVKLYGSLNRDI